jgi:hypothetical protein
MALTSPGVEVTIIDQSNYVPGATNSVPFILLATAQNKISGAGVGVASGTLAVNANKTFLMTSQRDLLSTFGVPFFYNTTAGTPINGYELNEYGLLAAYSALGITNQCYVQRVDVDLAALTASLTRPLGAPDNNTYWLDTTNTAWGIFEWNLTTGAFTNKVPLVITDTADLETASVVPLQSIGSIGDYAVTTGQTQTANVAGALQNPEYYKRGGPTSTQTSSTALSDLYNTWVDVGSDDWKTAWPSISGTLAPSTLVAANSIRINNTNTVAVPASANNTPTGLSAAINTANIAGVYSAVIGGAMFVYADSTSTGFNGTVSAGVANVTTGIATLTFTNTGNAVPTPYAVGSTITVAGTDSSNYNGSYVVTASTNISVSFSFDGANVATGNGLITSSGTVSINNVTGTPLASLGITAGAYSTPTYLANPSYLNPRWNSSNSFPQPTGSVWQKTNNVNLGTNLVVKRYNGTLGLFVQQACPVYATNEAALYALDPAGGGLNISAGSTYAQVDPYGNTTGGFMLFSRYVAGPTNITGYTVPGTFTSSETFTISASESGSSVLNTATATLTGTSVEDFIAAVSAAAVPYVSASIDSSGFVVFTHSQGGDIQLLDVTGTPVADAGFAIGQNIVGLTLLNVTGPTLVLSNWVSYPTFSYTSSDTAPDQDPANGTYWYYSDPTQVDIMIQDGGRWQGYQNVTSDIRGYDLSITNATGPIISATAPTTQTDTAESPLELGDLWIDTSNLELYPVIYRWESVDGVEQWVEIDNSNQTTQNGVLFADARWAPNGTTDPVADPLPTIISLLTSDYLDPDAVSPSLYPEGILLFNTRRSGFNVKTFQSNYFNATDYPAYPWSSTTTYSIGNLVTVASITYISLADNNFNNAVGTNAFWTPITVTNTWLTASGNRADGSPYMGRQAQRSIINQALRAGIDSNTVIREEQNQFNLIACPAYPELAPNLALLNADRGETAFVVVDTPLRLTPQEVVTWATNNNGLGVITGDGNLNAGDSYAAAFYPSCTTNDLSGNLVVTAPSHMMLRTIIRSDEVSFPWLAPAGTRRGVVDNATQIGYLNAQTGEFEPLGVSQGLRDVLYQNNVNPITFIPGVGITNFGNHTLQGTTTALDRINVARLVAFLRARLAEIGKTYLFEPNDTITRQQITNAITNLMIDLVAKRGIYDYLVVCDLSNNTPARIDANELYVDIAIEPVKAVEFIYIPVRIQNTGTIGATV